MPDAVLTFTFSPVQPFITEARRAARPVRRQPHPG